jgi:hypothetical protein
VAGKGVGRVSLERELERLDRRIRDVRAAIEVAYATRIPDEKKDVLFERLDALLRERGYLRLRFSNAVLWQNMRAAFARIWRRLRKRLAPLLAELQRLAKEWERSRPAFWRAVGEPSARVGALKLGTFSIALPANRRPWLPGYMRQKARG